MKKNVILLIVSLLIAVCLCGCDTEAERVSANLSQEADNFNIIRQVTVIDCITGDTMFQMTGRLSIKSDNTDHQLEITVEKSKNCYQKHFIGLSDNVTYVVEDLGVGNNNVSSYQYELNYNPKMWIPVTPKNVD